MTITLEDFRQGMRHYPAGVTVITTKTKTGLMTGLTASAVCSLSAEPPSLICCVNQISGALEPILEAGIFAVNLLAKSQENFSGLFSSPDARDEDRFAEQNWTALKTGSPVLKGATMSFDCELDRHMTVFTHTILVGKIVAVQGEQENAEPLLYKDGCYGGFTPLS